VHSSTGSCRQQHAQTALFVICDLGTFGKSSRARVTVRMTAGDLLPGSREGQVKISVTAGSRIAEDSTPGNNTAHALVRVVPLGEGRSRR
jgi:hypothetical protein